MELVLIAALLCFPIKALALLTTPTPLRLLVILMQIAHGLHQQWYELISLFALTKKEETEILNDLAIPNTLIDVEAYYYYSCSATATAYETVDN